MAASSDTVLEVFSGLGAGLGFGVLEALLGYSRLPNIILPTRTLVAPTSICDRRMDGWREKEAELQWRQTVITFIPQK